MKTCSFLFHILPIWQNCQIVPCEKGMLVISGINLQSVCNISDNSICKTRFLTYFLWSQLILHEGLFLPISYLTISTKLSNSVVPCEKVMLVIGGINLQSVCNVSDNRICKTVFYLYLMCSNPPWRLASFYFILYRFNARHCTGFIK